MIVADVLDVCHIAFETAMNLLVLFGMLLGELGHLFREDREDEALCQSGQGRRSVPISDQHCATSRFSPSIE